MTQSVRLDGVPAPSTTRYQCGPSTLACVLGFLGDPVPESEIAAAIYSPTARGTLLPDMAWFARQRGFETRIEPANLEALRRSVDNQQPPIVLLDLGLPGLMKPHITAITGYAPRNLLQLGSSTPYNYISLSDFERQWKRAGKMALFIAPTTNAVSGP